MRNSFILFQSYREYFEDLTGDEVKELMLAIFDYEKTRNKPANLSTKVGCYFLVIKQQLDKNYEEYLKQSEINRLNGAKGGRPKKPNGFSENRKNRMGFSETETNRKNHDNDIDNDVVNDNDIDNDNNKKKIIKEKAHRSKFQKPTKQEITDYAIQENYRTDIIDRFIDHYEANGWKVGKAGLPMKDWKATFRNWNRNSFEQTKTDQIEEILQAGRE